MAKTPLMQVKVFAPFRTYFEGQASSVSAANDTGPFDVLARHKNFMTILKPCTVLVRLPDKEDFQLKIEQGVMHVRDDRATIFLDI